MTNVAISSKCKVLKPKVCLTASGMLIVDGKLLLILHSKVGQWLAPGGHLDPDELPHQAAEREFLEETGLEVRAVQLDFGPSLQASNSTFHPLPMAGNFHWVCEDNYLVRSGQQVASTDQQKLWKKGCEKHFNYAFLMEPADSSAGLVLNRNTQETDDIRWFSKSEIQSLPDLWEPIRHEFLEAFNRWEQHVGA